MVASPFFSLAGLLMTVALARPVVEHKERVLEREGLDIMLVVDSSGSMETRDYDIQGRTVSRMAVTNESCLSLLRLDPMTRSALWFSVKKAFTQTPLTLDRNGMQQFLAQIDIGLAGLQHNRCG